MRRGASTLLAVLLVASVALAQSKRVRVTGWVEWVRLQGHRPSGPPPPPVVVTGPTREHSEGPVAFARRHLLVRKGEQSSARAPDAEFTTDADGGFSLALPAGTWCVVHDP